MTFFSAMGEEATPVLQAPPQYLADRYGAWREARSASDLERRALLEKNGQSPRAMVISCSDSRVDPNEIFAGGPGELFVVRNVANLAPAYRPKTERHETPAAIEFAVTRLGVSHLVILGHSGCGGVAAAHDLCSGLDDGAYDDALCVRQWIATMTPACEAVRDLKENRTVRLRTLERSAAAVSAGNLMTYPYVRDRVARGALTIHAMWFDIGSSTLHCLNPATGLYEPVR